MAIACNSKEKDQSEISICTALFFPLPLSTSFFGIRIRSNRVRSIPFVSLKQRQIRGERAAKKRKKKKIHFETAKAWLVSDHKTFTLGDNIQWQFANERVVWLPNLRVVLKRYKGKKTRRILGSGPLFS